MNYAIAFALLLIVAAVPLARVAYAEPNTDDITEPQLPWGQLASPPIGTTPSVRSSTISTTR